MTLLSQVLNEKTIALGVEASDWRDAVRRGGELLVAGGYAEPRYIDAMIRTVEELGAYIMVAPGLALPHARPEDGALKPGLSLITLKRPVGFSAERPPADIILSFVAADNTSHIGLLREVAALCSEPANLARIRAAATVAEIAELIRTGGGPADRGGPSGP